MADKLSKVEKQKILNDAKAIKKALSDEAKKYKNAKVEGRTKDFYKRAADLLKQEEARFTQKAIREQLKRENISGRMAEEMRDLKSFKRGSTSTNVARRILTTRTTGEFADAPQTTQAGARFYAGLKTIWWRAGMSEAEKKEAYSVRDTKIMKAFHKRNLLEVMEYLEEELNINLLDMLQDPAQYHEAVNAIQSYIREKGIDAQ